MKSIEQHINTLSPAVGYDPALIYSTLKVMSENPEHSYHHSLLLPYGNKDNDIEGELFSGNQELSIVSKFALESNGKPREIAKIVSYPLLLLASYSEKFSSSYAFGGELKRIIVNKDITEPKEANYIKANIFRDLSGLPFLNRYYEFNIPLSVFYKDVEQKYHIKPFMFMSLLSYKNTIEKSLDTNGDIMHDSGRIFHYTDPYIVQPDEHSLSLQRHFHQTLSKVGMGFITVHDYSQ